MTSIDKINILLKERGISGSELMRMIGASNGLYSQWNTGLTKKITNRSLKKVADALDVNIREIMDDADFHQFNSPIATDNVITFRVMGTVAAGYDHIIYEEFSDDTIEIPRSMLKNHEPDDFFVLRIIGDSMYPLFQQDDIVVVLKQETLRSGEIGVFLYDDDKVTLKRIDYPEDHLFLKLSPINPQYKPIIIKGESLAHCRILGIPKILIREFENEFN